MVEKVEISQIELLKRKLEREKAARLEAERLLEERSLQLYQANVELKALNESLQEENLVQIQEIHKQNHFFESVFNTLPAQLAVLDEKGRYIFINNRAIPDPVIREKCVGLTNEEIAEFVAYPEGVLEERTRIMNEQFIKPHTADWIEKWVIDGKDMYILRRLHPHFDSEGQLVMFIGYGVNVTQSVEDNIKLSKAKEAAEAATVAKSEFLSKMTHELRTPLNAITGLTDVMLKTPEEMKVKYLEAVKYSADSLLGIINEILDFSKIEAGKMVYENVNFNPKLVLSGVHQTFGLRASEKGLELTVDIDASVPSSLKGDPQKLSQALTNIVGNSVKFTKAGSIRVRAWWKESKEDKGILVTELEDTGIGIPKSKLKTIFKSFEQSSSSTSRTYGGTGLGLTITKLFIEGMKGSVDVKSEVNKGTKFTLEIPFVVPKSSSLNGKKGILHTSNQDYSTKKVLLVEDNEMNQLVFKKMVEKWNPQLFMVNNGEDALRWMKNDDWDMVFMDIQMPIKSGIETISEWREYESENNLEPLSVVALTADAFDESRNQALQSGMTDFATKPLSSEELGRVLSKYLD